MLWSKYCGQNGFYKMTSVGTQMWHIEALGLKCDYVCLSPVVTKVVCWTGVQSMQMLVAGISNLAWTAVVWPPPSLLSNFFYWQKQPCTVNIVKLWIRWTSLMSPWWVRMEKKNPLHSCKYSLCLRIKSLCFELLDSATGVVRPEVICLNQGIQQLDFVMPCTVLSTCLALCGAAWH